MKKAADIMSKTGKWLLVFGFVFSQLSFPLEALADELIDDENTYEDINVVEDIIELENTDSEEDTDGTEEDVQTSEPVITIDGTKYTIEYQDIVETIDFSNKLYGTYEYTFTSVDKTITINYLGNNAELLKVKEETTKNIVCNEEECIIDGFGTDYVTVGDINNYYDLLALNNKYNATTVITDGVNSLGDTENVINGYELVIEDSQVVETLISGVLTNITPKTTYTINRLADVNNDGLINIEDQEKILIDIRYENEVTSLSDINRDGKLSILDATHPIFIETLDVEDTAVLTNTLTSENDEIYVGDIIEVKLFVSGFNQLSLYGIEGLLSYDKNVLELVGANLYKVSNEVNNLGSLNLDNGKFAYVLGESFNDSEVALLTLKFEAKALGTSDITISNLIESYGLNAFELESDSVSTNIAVVEYGKGGDVEETPEDSTTEEDKTTEEDMKETTTEVTEDTKVVVQQVVKSNDYYISNLVIDGYEIDFDMYTYEYSIKVGSDVTSLDLSVLLNSSKSIYYIEGNENFKEGENLVYITVKAENGSTKTYVIKVEKEKAKAIEEKTEIDEDETEEEETSSVSKTIIIILIILVIIGLIYVIFKDDEEDTKEVKKESQPEKVKSEKAKVETKKSSEVKKKTTSSKQTKKSSKK